MKLIDTADISISPNRQRQFLDEFAIVELADSIAKHGLLHPISITEDLVLVAGERRFKAVQHLQKQGYPFFHNGERILPPFIPTVLCTKTDLLELEEVELAENLDRKDLTWQEQANTVARLHALRTKQNPSQTIKDTASELQPDGLNALGSNITSVSEDIKLAEQLSDPEVAKAKTKKEAVKIIREKATQAHRAELAEKFHANVESKSPHTLYVGDCREQIEKLSPGSVDCIIIDPPYGIDAQDFGEQAGVKHKYDDSLDYVEGLMFDLIPKLYAVAAEQSHLYMFCDFSLLPTLLGRLRDAGYYVWKTPLIWYKGNIGHLPRPEHAPRATYECIIYAIKGDKKTNHVAHDVICVNQTTNKSHSAQKPVELYTNLLSRSVKPGDTILDTFAGSGTVFEAAEELNCFATGFEMSDEYVAICKERIVNLGQRGGV